MSQKRYSVQSSDAVDQTEITSGTGTTMQLLIGPEEAPDFAMRKFTMVPGGGMPKHTNQVEHEQYVLKGKAIIGIEDDTYEVTQGDVIFLPDRAPHWYKAHGEEYFEFICVVPNRRDEIEILDE